MSGNRIAKAEELLRLRKNRNEVLDLVDCLQFADKRDLLLSSDRMRDHLGFQTNGEAEKLLDGVQELRDKLAHSQDIVSGTTWVNLINDVCKAEAAISLSDEQIEQVCGNISEANGLNK